MKQGRDGGRQAGGVESAFKNPQHPFRVAIVCANVADRLRRECPVHAYIQADEAHTLMQASPGEPDLSGKDSA